MSGGSCCRTGRCPRRQVEESRKRFSKACEEPSSQFQARWKEELTDIQVFTGCGEQRLKRTRGRIFFFSPFRRNKNTQRSSSSCLDLFGINLLETQRNGSRVAGRVSASPAVFASPSLTVLFLLSVFITVNYFPGRPAGSNYLKTIAKAKTHNFPLIGGSFAFFWVGGGRRCVGGDYFPHEMPIQGYLIGS